MDPELEQVVADIKKHFQEFPNAADTIDGIAAWWLAREHAGVPKTTVERALQLLVDTGFARARRTGNGAVIYALNKGTG